MLRITRISDMDLTILTVTVTDLRDAQFVGLVLLSTGATRQPFLMDGNMEITVMIYK